MSSGIEATILYQFGDVVNLMQEKKKDPNRVSRVLQALVSDDEIVIRPKSGKVGVLGPWRVRGNFASLEDAIKACDCPYTEDFAATPQQVPHIIQPVDCCVRSEKVHNVRLSDMLKQYPKLVDPLTLFTFGALYPDDYRLTQNTFWRDPNGTLWMARLDILHTSLGQRRAAINPVPADNSDRFGWKESTVMQEGYVLVRD